MSHRTLLLTACLLMSSAESMRADGFQFTNGRLAEEPIIEIQLTKTQMSELREHFKPGMKIKLTTKQQVAIRSKAKTRVSPTVLEIWKSSDLEGDCSCFLWNIGLLFKDGWVELPIHRIVSDKEAEDRQPDPEG